MSRLAALRSRLRQLFEDAFTDNPTVVRELRQRLSGGRLAYTLTLATTLQSVFLLVGFAYYLQEPQAFPGLSLGHVLYLLWSLALLTYVALIAPVRGLGLFDWERRRKSLDQHVTSGSSPLRTIGGKVAISAALAVEVVIASLPIACVAVWIGDIPWWWVAEQELLALAFGFAILTGFIWGSASEPESAVAVGMAIVVLLVLGLSVPLCISLPQLALITPYAALHAHLAPLAAHELPQLVAPMLFGTELPQGGWVATVLYLSLGLVGLLASASGPRRVLGPEGTTFGTLISSGKGAWRKWAGSYFSRRRADIVFLYENRSAWLRRNGEALRELRTLLLFVLGLFLFHGLLCPPVWQGNAELHAAVMLIGSSLFVWGVAMRGIANRRELAVPGENVRAPLWWCVTAGLFAIALLPPLVTLSAAPPGRIHINLLPLHLLLVVHGIALFVAVRGVSLQAKAKLRGWIALVAFCLLLHAGLPIAFLLSAEKGAMGMEHSWLALLSVPYCAFLWIERWHYDHELAQLTIAAPSPDGDYLEEQHRMLEFSEPLGYALVLLAILLVPLVFASLREWFGWFRRRRAAVATVAAALLAMGVVTAQEPEMIDPTVPQVRLIVGFDGVIPHGQRIPLVVEVIAGEVPFAGELRVANRAGEWIREFLDMAAGERRVVRTVGPERAYGRSLQATLRRTAAGIEDEVARVEPRTWFRTDVDVLLVDDLRKERGPGQGDEGAANILSCTSLALPVEARAYAGVPMVVLGRVSEPLTPRQVRALEAFVAAGGTLVVSTGQPQAPRPGLSPLVPAGVWQLEDVADGPIPLLGAVDPELATEQVGQLSLQPLLEAGARAELESGGQVLACSFARGLGQVVVVSFDPWVRPLARTPGTGLLLSMLRRELQYDLQGAWPSWRVRDLARERSLLRLILAILAAPLLVGLVPYLVARLQGRPYRVWLYAPVGAAVGIVVVPMLASWSSPTLVAVDRLRVVPAAAGAPAFERIEVAAVSAGAELESLEVPGQWHELERYSVTPGSGRMTPDRVVEGVPAADGQSSRVEGIGLKRWLTGTAVGHRQLERGRVPPPTLWLGAFGSREIHAPGLDELGDLSGHAATVGRRTAMAVRPAGEGRLAVVESWSSDRLGISLRENPDAWLGEGEDAARHGEVHLDLAWKLQAAAGTRPLLLARRPYRENRLEPGVEHTEAIEVIALEMRPRVRPGEAVRVSWVEHRFLGQWSEDDDDAGGTKPVAAPLLNEIRLPQPVVAGDFEIEQVELEVDLNRGSGFEPATLEAWSWVEGRWLEIAKGRPAEEFMPSIRRPRRGAATRPETLQQIVLGPAFFRIGRVLVRVHSADQATGRRSPYSRVQWPCEVVLRGQ